MVSPIEAKDCLFEQALKDKFKDGALYYIQHPYVATFVLTKASINDGGRRLNFFFCDVEGFVKWSDVEYAYRIKTKLPTHLEIMRE